MIRLKLLGSPTVEGRDGPMDGPVAQRQKMTLLAFLAMSPQSQVSRDKVLAYLWPDASAESARHALSNAIYVVKKELGEDAIVATSDQVRLNRHVVDVDALQFGDACEAGDLERALDLYSGPFLDGFHAKGGVELQQWLDVERRQLEGRHGRALETLARQAENEGELVRAVELWRRLAALDSTLMELAYLCMAEDPTERPCAADVVRMIDERLRLSKEEGAAERPGRLARILRSLSGRASS